MRNTPSTAAETIAAHAGLGCVIGTAAGMYVGSNGHCDKSNWAETTAAATLGVAGGLTGASLGLVTGTVHAIYNELSRESTES